MPALIRKPVCVRAVLLVGLLAGCTPGGSGIQAEPPAETRAEDCHYLAMVPQLFRAVGLDSVPEPVRVDVQSFVGAGRRFCARPVDRAQILAAFPREVVDVPWRAASGQPRGSQVPQSLRIRAAYHLVNNSADAVIETASGDPGGGSVVTEWLVRFDLLENAGVRLRETMVMKRN